MQERVGGYKKSPLWVSHLIQTNKHPLHQNNKRGSIITAQNNNNNNYHLLNKSAWTEWQWLLMWSFFSFLFFTSKNPERKLNNMYTLEESLMSPLMNKCSFLLWDNFVNIFIRYFFCLYPNKRKSTYCPKWGNSATSSWGELLLWWTIHPSQRTYKEMVIAA